jgi:hypothetical protein
MILKLNYRGLKNRSIGNKIESLEKIFNTTREKITHNYQSIAQDTVGLLREWQGLKQTQCSHEMLLGSAQCPDIENKQMFIPAGKIQSSHFLRFPHRQADAWADPELDVVFLLIKESCLDNIPHKHRPLIQEVEKERKDPEDCPVASMGFEVLWIIKTTS